jgi:hypothetical protein
MGVGFFAGIGEFGSYRFGFGLGTPLLAGVVA